MTSSSEKWTEIKEVSGYQVSSFGRVRSMDRVLPFTSRTGDITSKKYKGKILNTYVDKKGYEIARFGRGSKRYKIHRLVAKAYLPPPTQELINSCTNPMNGVEVNHKDGIKTNNHVNNLEWCNGKSNAVHASELGLYHQPIGTKNSRAKLDEYEVLEIRARRTAGEDVDSLSSEYQVTTSTIYKICTKESWSHI